MIPYLNGVDTFLGNPGSSNLRFAHFIVFSSDARRYGIKAETRFSIRSVFQAYALRQVAPWVWIAGTHPFLDFSRTGEGQLHSFFPVKMA